MFRAGVQDAAELEQILRQHLTPPDLLRSAHASFRAFRALLFAPASDIGPATPTAAVPVATALLHCFSRLPDTIRAPWERSGVSVRQFSQWLDQHSEAEALRSIADSIAGARAGGGESGAVLARMRLLAQAA